MDKVFLAIYTNEAKQYCDEDFYENISTLLYDKVTTCVVDNSKTTDYLERVKGICEDNDINARYKFIEVEDGQHRFQRSVLKSVEYLRKVFLTTDCDYFLIIETDVIPPDGTIRKMVKTMNDNPDYGAIGCVYYNGIHSFTDEYLVEEDCVFSGCTMYRREMLEDIPFTWYVHNEGCFPDSCMKQDAVYAGWRVGNIRNIHCKHIKQ
jgi:hypothetical protein